MIIKINILTSVGIYHFETTWELIYRRNLPPPELPFPPYKIPKLPSPHAVSIPVKRLQSMLVCVHTHVVGGNTHTVRRDTCTHINKYTQALTHTQMDTHRCTHKYT